jgi:hypothetical protein
MPSAAPPPSSDTDPAPGADAEEDEADGEPQEPPLLGPDMSGLLEDG